jgi:hypothetical protein
VDVPKVLLSKKVTAVPYCEILLISSKCAKKLVFSISNFIPNYHTSCQCTFSYFCEITTRKRCRSHNFNHAAITQCRRPSIHNSRYFCHSFTSNKIQGRYYWQKGEKRGTADWEAIKKIRETLGNDIPIIGNGNIGQHIDFSRIIKETGVNAGMAGYGALVKPCIFQEEEISEEKCVSDYLNIARSRENLWIDILRHVQWMLKNYSIQPMQTAALFQTKNYEDLK